MQIKPDGWSNGKTRGSNNQPRGFGRGSGSNGTNAIQSGFSHNNCDRCGFDHGGDLNRCPALKLKCHQCNKVGHYQRMCPNEHTNEEQNGMSTQHGQGTHSIADYESEELAQTCLQYANMTLESENTTEGSDA